MSEALLTAAAGLFLFGGFVAIRELRWRRLIGSELAPEVALGILSKRDYEALRGWRRFRGGWLVGARERRAFCRIAGKLARAKAAQRHALGDRGRLLQVQVLTFRTRLRQIHANKRLAGVAGGDDSLSTP